MARSGPDWGLRGGKATVFPLTDMAELAARLRSIDVYDRAGDVIALDDFQSGIDQWEHSGSGSGKNTTFVPG